MYSKFTGRCKFFLFRIVFCALFNFKNLNVFEEKASTSLPALNSLACFVIYFFVPNWESRKIGRAQSKHKSRTVE